MIMQSHKPISNKMEKMREDSKNIKFNPCAKCINELRYKLFMNKTNCGMTSFRDMRNIMKQFYDMYTGNVNIDNTHNIEHIIPLSVFIPKGTRRSIDNIRANINNEPYSDFHILVPTNKDINTVRANHAMGHISKNRDESYKRHDTIINRDNIINSPIKVTQLKKVNSLNELGDQLNDIYLHNPRGKGNECTSDTYCIFQPPLIFAGDISRIIFYFFLMYGYDFSKRPYEHPQYKNKEGENIEHPWFFDEDGISCVGFNYSTWEHFFFGYIIDYYVWHKSDIVNDIERNRNKLIIKHTSVPNIFVGYADKDNIYHDADVNIVEDLLFGREHDHNIYTNMEFYKLPYNETGIQISTKNCVYNKYVYNDNMTADECRKTTLLNTKNAMNVQKSLYNRTLYDIQKESHARAQLQISKQTLFRSKPKPKSKSKPKWIPVSQGGYCDKYICNKRIYLDMENLK